MNGFYSWLSGVIPLTRILISLAVALIFGSVVVYAGMNSDFVLFGTVLERGFNAFSFSGLVTFIGLMSVEEYAIWKTKRELERFIESAQLSETAPL